MAKKDCEVCANPGDETKNAGHMREAENKLEHGNEAEVVEHGNHFADLPDELDLVGNKAEEKLVGHEAEDEIEHDKDFADLPAQDKPVGKKAKEQFRFQPRGGRYLRLYSA
ncbi:hypothetical protein FN846DRAFT_912301 [Sphaerosporella brunnea]|uniref:Uncharacterized protein n=1 Tax=Sphaerosporella brunnea TaxID=1250544 RepID=A0A5J5EGX5_9PEZI|nr:hypothetical protein FN846DRAFT_912301 [Sphaerosporella brunnea]